MLVFSGCSGTRSDALLGAWQTGVIPCEWGSNQITVQFLADGRVVGTNDFVSGGPLSWEGTYRVRGNVIQRTIKGDMQEIAYWIEGDRLRMQIDHEDYRFIRLGSPEQNLLLGKLVADVRARDPEITSPTFTSRT